MKNYINELNDNQKKACLDTDGPSLIIAGAGSGKTKVLTSRIAYLLDNKGVLPRNILAITFTNKAAKEMKDRLYKLVGPISVDVTCKTFHSFCAYFLRNEISVLSSRKRTFQIIDDDDTLKMVKEALEYNNLNTKTYKASEFAMYISEIKSRMRTLDSFNEFYKNPLMRVMDRYNKELIKNNLLDFDDLQLLTVEILENYPSILERYQNTFKYILVDEFQDTSNIQYEMVKLLANRYKNIFIVGDEDQSIYSFRGANINNIKKFMKDFPSHSKHILDENYRSTNPILEEANRLISNNTDRIVKNLWTKREAVEDVSLVGYDTDKYEARGIANKIRRMVDNNKINYSDIAILYRNNYLSRNIENELIYEKIPYMVYSGLSFYKRKEVKDMMAYLRLILDMDDFYSFKRIINTPKRGIGEQTINKILNTIEKDGTLLFDSFDNSPISSSTKTTLNNFKLMIYDLNTRVNDMPLKELFKYVYDKTGYKSYIEDIEDEDERDQRELNIEELFTAINECETVGSNREVLEDFLLNASLLTDQDVIVSNPDHVSLMTMHTAKGLEYKAVFVTALEKDIIPSIKSFDLKEIEEERRLLYVAMTRAKDYLFLSYARERYKFGSSMSAAPSRFIKDLKVSSRTEREDTNKNIPKVEYDSSLFKVNEEVHHEMFGDGVILAIIDGFYIVNFPKLSQKKKVIFKHPLLKRINE